MEILYFTTLKDQQVADEIIEKYNIQPRNGFRALNITGKLLENCVPAFIETLNSTYFSSGNFNQISNTLATKFEQHLLNSHELNKTPLAIEKYAQKLNSIQWYYDFINENTFILFTPK
jgi:hypothetical protein